jgi:hypothetical protein
MQVRTRSINNRKHATTTAAALLLLAASSRAFIASPSKFVAIQQNQRDVTGVGSACRDPNFSFHRTHSRSPWSISMKTAISDTEMEAEINKMRVKEIRDELESYGISTKSFFEKSELAEALLAARKEGKTSIKDVNGTSATSSASSSDTSTSSTTNRQERIQQEIDRCKSMKVSDLKKELESYGLPTKSYFEKSEFVRAVAEARVDGVTEQPGGSGGSGARQQREEPRDPSYRDVVVTKFSPEGKMMLGGTVIDVKAR